MPDGDQVQSEIAAEYRRGYRKTCRGTLGDDDIANEERARAMVSATIERIKSYGGEPFQVFAEVVRIAEQLPLLPIFKDTVNEVEILKGIERFANNMSMNKRARHIVLYICKEQMKAIFNGTQAKNVYQELLVRYQKRVYRVDCEAFTESAPDHRNNMSPADYNALAQRMRPEIEAQFVKAAAKVQLDEGLKQEALMLPRRKARRQQGVFVNENLLC